MLITLPTFYILENSNVVSPNGTIFHFWASGIVIFSAVVYVTNLKILLISNTLNLFQIIILIGSVLFYYSNFAALSAYFVVFDIYSTFGLTFNCSVFYLVFMLHIFTTTILELFYSRFKSKCIDL